MNKQTLIIIACILLGVALLPLPYGYYQFIRLCVCGLSIWLLIDNYNKNLKLLTGLIFSAIAYNPIFKIHFDKEVWSVINIITLIYFCYLILQIEKSKKC